MPLYQGVYRGTVVDSSQPAGQKRLQVDLPLHRRGARLGDAMPAARRECGVRRLHDRRQGFFAFENGDVTAPVVLGKFLFDAAQCFIRDGARDDHPAA